jgi:hypothetical protein
MSTASLSGPRSSAAPERAGAAASRAEERRGLLVGDTGAGEVLVNVQLEEVVGSYLMMLAALLVRRTSPRCLARNSHDR